MLNFTSSCLASHSDQIAHRSVHQGDLRSCRLQPETAHTDRPRHHTTTHHPHDFMNRDHRGLFTTRLTTLPHHVIPWPANERSALSNRTFLSLDGNTVIGFKDPEPTVEFHGFLIAVRGGRQDFSGGHRGHVVRHPVRKHEPPFLDDDIKLVDHPPIRIRAAHESPGFFIRTEDDKRLMSVPLTIRPSIGGRHPKTQKAPARLPASDHLLLDGSVLKRQLHVPSKCPNRNLTCSSAALGFSG